MATKKAKVTKKAKIDNYPYITYRGLEVKPKFLTRNKKWLDTFIQCGSVYLHFFFNDATPDLIVDLVEFGRVNLIKIEIEGFTVILTRSMTYQEFVYDFDKESFVTSKEYYSDSNV
jgi:hypothetical protein